VLRDHAEERHRALERRRLERLAAMGTMVAGFAHELRNPMASLRSLAESLAEEPTEAGVTRPHLARMLGTIERVERLVRSSLSFGCPAPPRARVHRPASIVLAAASSLLPRTRPHGELGLDAEAELPDVSVDDGQLVQILVILLENALDAAGSPSRVTLSASLEAPSPQWRGRRSAHPPLAEVRFAVRDHGPGVPPELRERILDPFYTTEASGTGLGLSIAQHLAAENGARLELASTPGGPTTFSVLLPALPRSVSTFPAP
jgi:signal transduction histidine kinase